MKKLLLNRLSAGELKVTDKLLREHPNWVFVFGDNQIRKGYGGGASLRDLHNTYGFVTKKRPCRDDAAYFTPDEYRPIFDQEVVAFNKVVTSSPPEVIFLVSKLGYGLANRFSIWEEVIEPWWNSLGRSSKFVLLH